MQLVYSNEYKAEHGLCIDTDTSQVLKGEQVGYFIDEFNCLLECDYTDSCTAYTYINKNCKFFN